MALLATTIGCSSKQVYEAIQESWEQECRQMPVAQYEDCIEGYEQSYDSYKKPLDEATGQ